MSELEREILETVRHCQRRGIKPTVRNVAENLPPRFRYTEQWIGYHLRLLNSRQMVRRVSRKGGYKTLAHHHTRVSCPTCGSLVSYQQLALF